MKIKLYRSICIWRRRVTFVAFKWSICILVAFELARCLNSFHIWGIFTRRRSWSATCRCSPFFIFSGGAMTQKSNTFQSLMNFFIIIKIKILTEGLMLADWRRVYHGSSVAICSFSWSTSRWKAGAALLYGPCQLKGVWGPRAIFASLLTWTQAHRRPRTDWEECFYALNGPDQCNCCRCHGQI